ncbi:glycosyltransferase [Streptococcus suis]|nr:glycosyltransferase [Streptococcus suis]AKE79559.1 glycosyltransferase [Streptococcus suis]AKE80032.1 glycosyltransferase [Streptococcus suis]AKE80053.1 glycosyltransferase [Streptococcus suis]AKE80094.1 glycosyltransferase [Streptococcus suis]AKE80377.1 glycosyltransferase [Streptococcus suis]
MSVYEKEDPLFLRESLESILIHQTVIPTEVILVEDGPLNDGLYSVLEEFKGQFAFFKTIALKENVGLGAALNEGMKHCSYDWVARMDTDDIAAKYRFERQLKFLQDNPDIDVLGGAISEFGNSVQDIKAVKQLPKEHSSIQTMLKRRSPMSHVTVFFRKASVVAAGGYQTLMYIEDYYLWARMITSGFRMANLDDILVHVRVGNGMYSRRGNREYIRSWKILNQYMLENKLITGIDLTVNMLLIRGFIFLPPKLKEFVYKRILRK